MKHLLFNKIFLFLYKLIIFCEISRDVIGMRNYDRHVGEKSYGKRGIFGHSALFQREPVEVS